MIPFVKRISLGELLVKSGKVAQEVINQVSLEYRGKGKRLGEALIEKGVINEEDLAEHLAEQFHLSYYRLDHFRLDPAFFKKIPVELMYRYPFVPYGEKEGAMKIMRDLERGMKNQLEGPITSCQATSLAGWGRVEFPKVLTMEIASLL